MSTDSTPEPLGITDPRRQAADTIRAYEYQIWQSVSRWVTLKPGEELYLEKAEDFDVVRETPEDRLVANTNLLLTGNAYAMWREETEEFVCNVVAKGWRAVVEQQ